MDSAQVHGKVLKIKTKDIVSNCYIQVSLSEGMFLFHTPEKLYPKSL